MKELFIIQETGLTENVVKNLKKWWWTIPAIYDEVMDKTFTNIDEVKVYCCERKEAFPEEDIERVKKEIIKKKQEKSLPLQALNFLLSSETGRHFFKNLAAYLSFEYELSNEEEKITEAYNKKYGKNYKAFIKSKNKYVDSAYLNKAFLVAMQENLVKLKEEYEATKK